MRKILLLCLTLTNLYSSTATEVHQFNSDGCTDPSAANYDVSATMDDVQDLEVRVVNVVGEAVYTENIEQFVGEYTKRISLKDYAKGIYFLEIETSDGLINKKLILQ